MKLLTDRWGRRVTRLRLAVSDRCNLRCVYCDPRPSVSTGREALTADEIAAVAEAAVFCGIESIRFTGGEPLLREDLLDIVARVSRLSPDLDLALTTNGSLLAGLAGPLAGAGLKRVNVSLDSLREERFRALTGGGSLGSTLAGLEAARRAGLRPVKINTVVMRGANDEEVLEIVEFAAAEGYHARFIEFMPLDGEGRWDREAMAPVAEIRARLEENYDLVPRPENSSPGEEYVLPALGSRISLIGAISRPFCHRCNRLRVTADGWLRPCLFSREEHELRPALADHSPTEAVAAALAAAAAAKPAGHRVGQADFRRPARPMVAIGG